MRLAKPDVPDVSCEMLAPGEAQAARWVVGAVESLRLLLLARSGIIGIHAFVIGSDTVFARASSV